MPRPLCAHLWGTVAWLDSGEGNLAKDVWTSNCIVIMLLQPSREALAKYLKDHCVPVHRFWPVSTAEIAAQQLPELRGPAP